MPRNRHVRASPRSKVLAIVAAIPEGCVTTYGSIGKRLKLTARQVARALSSLTSEESEELPWFRVVAANGAISTVKLGALGRRQTRSRSLRRKPVFAADVRHRSGAWPTQACTGETSPRPAKGVI